LIRLIVVEEGEVMKEKARFTARFGLFAGAMMLLAACGSATAPTSAPTSAPAAAASATQGAAMQDKATTTPDKMMAATGTPDAMLKTTATPDAMMAATAMKETPDAMTTWVHAELMNVRTGATLRVADLKGKVVLLETMAIWCTNCLQQQKQVQALHASLGARDDLVTINLDVDPNENGAQLKAYAEKNNFDWTYAVAPRDVARELSSLYGAQFLNPTATPMLIVDRNGEIHPLPFGIKSAQALQDALQPYLK
jgi:thiol:disulfide interchange protein